MQKLNIVYLDIDGVLNIPGKTANIQGSKLTGLEPGLIKRLSEFCNETNSKVVLSSSWRHSYTHKYFNFLGKYLDTMFKKYKIECVDVTPMLSSRELEITDHIYSVSKTKNGYQLDKFIIIDDDPLKFENEEYNQRFIKTDSTSGFTEEIYNKALELMR